MTKKLNEVPVDDDATQTEETAAAAAAPAKVEKVKARDRRAKEKALLKDAFASTAARHGRRTRGAPLETARADQARQGARLPDVRRNQRPPARQLHRNRSDRRHHQHVQRHGRRRLRAGARCRNAAAERQRARRFVATTKSKRKPKSRCPPSIPNSAAPPTRCACTCAKWARSNC